MNDHRHSIGRHRAGADHGLGDLLDQRTLLILCPPLGDLNDEDGAQDQLEKALEVETNNPAVYNNLANIYGHHGPVKRAFEFYSKAIDLNPNEPVYYQNLATTVFLFRPDAMEFYKIDEPQVFDKALELYRKAMRLDPDNFVLASDYAQSYYGIRPMRTGDAIAAWESALKIAPDDKEREGVYIHLARIKLNAERFEEAHRLLMRAHHESGDAALAMRHYQALEAMLRRDLGAEPEPATRELFQRIKRSGG